MGNIGAGELIFIAIFALLVFGPKRLPEIGRSVGKALAEVRKATNELKEGFTSGFEDFNFNEIRELRDLTSFRDLKEPLILNGPIKATGGTGATGGAGATRQTAPTPPTNHPNQASLTAQASPSNPGEPAGSPGPHSPVAPSGTSAAGTDAGPIAGTSGTGTSQDPGPSSTPGTSGEDGATRT